MELIFYHKKCCLYGRRRRRDVDGDEGYTICIIIML